MRNEESGTSANFKDLNAAPTELSEGAGHPFKG
jgi:hypothetical protein